MELKHGVKEIEEPTATNEAGTKIRATTVIVFIVRASITDLWIKARIPWFPLFVEIETLLVDSLFWKLIVSRSYNTLHQLFYSRELGSCLVLAYLIR